MLRGLVIMLLALLVPVLLTQSSWSLRNVSRDVSEVPQNLSEDDFVGVATTGMYNAFRLREGESAQEFFFDDLIGLKVKPVDGGYRFKNAILDVRDSEIRQQMLDWGLFIGAKSYLINDGSGGLLFFRNAFQSSLPGDPVIGASAFYTMDDTNLCGYIAVAYLYNGLTGAVKLSPMEVILAQTTMPAGRGLTTFFPALPPLSLHLGGITPRDLDTVADRVLEGTGYTAKRIPGPLGDTQIGLTIRDTLRAGLPLIAFVSIYYEGGSNGYRSDANGVLTPKGTYGHFVVVTGFAEKDEEVTYRIRNPYDNRVEYYAEPDFLASVIRSSDLEYGGSLILVEHAKLPDDLERTDE